MFFLILILILAIGIFIPACSNNATPDVPDTTNEDNNKNGRVDYNNENGKDADDPRRPVTVSIITQINKRCIKHTMDAPGQSYGVFWNLTLLQLLRNVNNCVIQKQIL